MPRKKVAKATPKQVETGNIKNVSIEKNFTTGPVVVPPPVPPEQPPVPPMQYEMPPQQPGGGGLFLVVSVIILLAAIGGVIYAYYAGFFENEEQDIAQAFQMAQDATSGSFDVTIAADLSELKGDDAQAFLNEFLGGGTSKTARIRTEGSFAKDDEGTLLDATISFGVGAFTGAVDIRTIDETMYAQITKAPENPLIDLSEFENRWISFPFSMDEENAGSPLGSPMTLTGIDPMIFQELTQEQKDELLTISKNAELITVSEIIGEETVGGALSNHYSFDLNREGIVAYVQSMNAFMEGVSSDNSLLATFQPEDIEQQLNSVQNFAGDIWIGKEDNLPHKISIGFTVGSPEDPDMGTVGILVEGIFRDWNEEVLITPPENSVTVEEFMEEFYNASF